MEVGPPDKGDRERRTMNLQGNKIVVVGGSSGMGLASAQALAEAGATVVIASRSLDKLEAAKTKIPGKVETYSLDFTVEKAVEVFFAHVGSIDHLVIAAAGAPAWGGFLDFDPQALRNAFETKFWGHFYCGRHGVSHLRSDGSITFFIGGACRAAIPGTSGLAAVNGAIMCMAYTLAKELAPLRVNAISPGPVDTPAYDPMPKERKEAFFAQIARDLPVKRIGRPQEVAQAVLFLITNEFITGAVLDVDGGARLR
jgi:NAD(P)-dependent dehydrogenase (short-subunit alcohol dehydrogenase family)